MLATPDVLAPDKEAATRVRPDMIDSVELRLKSLAQALGPRAWLAGNAVTGDAVTGDAFMVADLMMATVLRIPRHTDIVSGFPTLDACPGRCTDRPAFKAALEAQLQPFAENAERYEGAA